ncbi:hypothetical protein BGX27_002938 [Mortierella sp. AM989]|nr:hypothetical protein BGX27_002938 [Mortierella sp. AM989]
MFQDDNFFAIHDLSRAGLFLWASPSIYSCLGYEPDEVIGMSPYQWIHPDDIAACEVAHQENVLNEIAGTQMFFRIRRKNGTFVPCVILGCICYQYIVSCYTIMDDTTGTIQKGINHAPVHSAAMANLMGSKEKEFERISRNHKAFSASSWNHGSLDLELRACLLLNRFTRNLCIMYASPSCQLIFDIDPDDLLGKPLLLYIRADDLASFVEQGDIARSSATVRHLRFWFQSPNCREEIPCEAMFLGASDALIVILRKCLPFRRRQFITDHSPSGYYASASSASRGFSRRYTTSSRNNTALNRYGNLHSIVESPVGAAMLASSPADSISSSVSSTLSTSSQEFQEVLAPQTPLRNIPGGSINSIRVLSKDQDRLRPLTSLREVHPDSVDPDATSTEAYLMREFHSVDAEDVESEIVDRVHKIKLHSASVEDIEKEDLEDGWFGASYYDDEIGEAMIDEEIEEIQMPSSRGRHSREE